jgi:pimeloyl-ACP methyl ester carboxylesterase
MTSILVYVHGLWFTGREALLLRRRLAANLALECRVFSYPSVSASASDNAAALGRFLSGIRADTLHIVGHSLGGVVIAKLFQNPPQLPPGRIVLLGSPLNGSRAGQLVTRLPFGRSILGRTMAEDVLTPPPRRWSGVRELGVIAGGLSFGLGRLVGRLPTPNDGTVTVAETALPGATDSVVLPVTHTGLLFSRDVVSQTAAFLRSGRFVH